MQRALVVGGSGFLGSAICKACVARGWSVVSLSRNGEPKGKGREPGTGWMDKVEWRQGSVFDEDTLKAILPEVTSVVHTLGILLETDYKSKGLTSLLGGIAAGLTENASRSRNSANPLANPRSATGQHSSASSAPQEGLYEKINRDSAIRVLQAYLETRASSGTMGSSGTASAPPLSLQENPFVYISAEDIFRPVIPARYILTKRQAEEHIFRLSDTARSMVEEGMRTDNEGESLEVPGRLVRPIILRPSLIYHPTQRPPSALPATLLNLSSKVQSVLPTPLRTSTLSSIFSSSPSTISPQDLPSAASSMSNLLSIPPIHVDTVAQAVVQSIEDQSVRGVLGVKDMLGILKGRGTGYTATTVRPHPQACP